MLATAVFELVQKFYHTT